MKYLIMDCNGNRFEFDKEKDFTDHIKAIDHEITPSFKAYIYLESYEQCYHEICFDPETNYEIEKITLDRRVSI